MRDKPFEPTDTPEANTWRQHSMDLTSHLKQPARDNTAGAGSSATGGSDQSGDDDSEDTQSEKQQAAADGDAAASGTFDDGAPEARAEKQFDNFVKQLEEADAVTLANILVQIFNVGRVFFVPNLYFNLTFNGQERYDIRTVMDKAVENEKQNKKPIEGFNDYEKRLYGKLPRLREATENCSYTQPEMEELSKLLARRIQEMTVAVFLARYMWILMILFLEIKHGQFIIEQKGSDFFNNKLGMK